MPNVSRKSIHQALDRAANTIVVAGGRDGRTSRTDVDTKLKEMTGDERALVDTFYRFVDHRDARSGASVTKADVKDALAYAKASLVNVYDTDNNGLSAQERTRMSQVGQLAANIAERGDTPTKAAQEAVKVLVTPRWTANALPALEPSALSPSAKRSFDQKARRAEGNDLLDHPIARKLTAGGASFSVVAQFTHDSFVVELYNANGRRVAHGSGWGAPETPIDWD